jgi:hypothetical protein
VGVSMLVDGWKAAVAPVPMRPQLLNANPKGAACREEKAPQGDSDGT